MACKLALIVAVAFVAQGTAFRFGPVESFGSVASLPRGAMAAVPAENPLCNANIMPVSGDEITKNFEEVLNQMDEIRETVSLAAMQATFQGETDPKVVIACFLAQRRNYIALGVRINYLLLKASTELASDIQGKFVKYVTKIEKSIRIIGITFKTVPQRVISLIKRQQFGKAFELIIRSRQVVAENVKVLVDTINEIRVEVPQIAEKVEKAALEISNEAQKGALAIREAFLKCVEEGGPKKPIEDNEEVEEEVEEVEEVEEAEEEPIEN